MDLYCLPYVYTVSIDHIGTTVLVGKYLVQYVITVIVPLRFADSLQESKLHKLSIH